MKEAYLYQKLKNEKVRCQTCCHQCIILPGKQGICQVRENRNGKLYSLVYAKACAENIDPIEKKPLYHFRPGSRSLSIATVGCNFRCLHCQNWQISQQQITDNGQQIIIGENLLPKKVVEDAIKNNCQSIAYTYTEPTIFLEYALDTMKLAKIPSVANETKRSKGSNVSGQISNVWVSNGYMTKETIELIAPYLDAINIDLKSFSDDFYQKYCRARLSPVLESLKLLRRKKIHLEITTLIIPSLNDSNKELEQIAKFVFQELSPETPWHLSRFFPAYQALKHPITPIETLIRGRKIGLRAGLKYVYLGNVGDHSGNDTYCPECQALMIERTGYQIRRFDKDGKCSKCEANLDILP